MKKPMKIALIVAAALVLVGGISVVTAFALGGSLKADDLQAVTHTVDAPFASIVISAQDADVTLRTSDSDRCYAVCREDDRVHYSLTVENGQLILDTVDERRWYDFITISADFSREVTLYLPAGSYAGLDIRTSAGNIVCTDQRLSFTRALLTATSGDICYASPTENLMKAHTSSGDIELSDLSPLSLEASATSGDISISDVSADALHATVSSGDLDLSYVRGRELAFTASSGSIRLYRVLASSALTAKSSSGNITLKSCDAPALTLTASSGNITGSLLTDKLFDARAGSGNISCPPSVQNGGTCTVRTSSGNIRLHIADE